MNPATDSVRGPRWALNLALAGSAVIHLLPLLGLLSVEMLQRLYGLANLDPATILLLQHRAAVFGLMGTMLLIAMFRPALRTPSMALVGASDLIFLGLALMAWPLGAELTRVLAYDVVSLVFLAYVALATLPRRA